MTMPTDNSLLELATGQVVTLDDAVGARIRARFGTLWVTEEGDTADHIGRGKAEWNKFVGHGRINAFEALRAARRL